MSVEFILFRQGASLSVHGASSGWLPSVPSWFPGGAVSWFVPARLADEVLAQARSEAAAAGPEPPRPRVRLLPPRLGLCFVLCLCLSSGLPYLWVPITYATRRYT